MWEGLGEQEEQSSDKDEEVYRANQSLEWRAGTWAPVGQKTISQSSSSGKLNQFPLSSWKTSINLILPHYLLISTSPKTNAVFYFEKVSASNS